MQYRTIRDLPAATKDLPEQAKTVWMEAYRAEWDACADDQRSSTKAWAAVKARYIKAGGKWKAMPVPTAEVFAPMPLMLLAESDDVLAETVDLAWVEDETQEADAPQRLIATLIKAGDNKSGTRRYTPDFLQKCVAEGRFTGSFSYVNHPTRQESQERPERDVRYLAARTGEAYWDSAAQAVKAPLVWLAEEHPASMGSLTSALFADPVVRQRSGLSIYYQGPVQVGEADHPTRKGRKIMVPQALGDDRKFDVDIVTAPGAGGSLPLLETDGRDREEGTPPMTLDELKEQHPELVEALREEFVADLPPAPPEEVAPSDPVVAEVAEVEAPKPEATAPGNEALLREVAELKSWQMLETALRAEPVDETIREAVRKQLANEVFPTEEAFRAKFAATVTGMKEVASQAAGPRVADLGGTPPADAAKYTLGDLTQKKEA